MYMYLHVRHSTVMIDMSWCLTAVAVSTDRKCIVPSPYSEDKIRASVIKFWHCRHKKLLCCCSCCVVWLMYFLLCNRIPGGLLACSRPSEREVVGSNPGRDWRCLKNCYWNGPFQYNVAGPTHNMADKAFQGAKSDLVVRPSFRAVVV